MLGALLGISGEAVEVHTTTEVDGTTMPDHSDEVLPGWLSEADVDYYTAEFSRTGYRGALNWYRNHRQNWEYMSAWHQAPIKVPAMFVGGDRDPVRIGPERERWWTRLDSGSSPICACFGHIGRLRPLDPAGTTGGDQRSLARLPRRPLNGAADRSMGKSNGSNATAPIPFGLLFGFGLHVELGSMPPGATWSKGAEMISAGDSNDISSLPQADQDAIGATLISR